MESSSPEMSSTEDVPDVFQSLEPHPLRSDPPIPEFPLDSFPPWLAAYCSAVAESTQTRPDSAGMLALCTLSAVLRGRCDVVVRQSWREPVVVQALTVAAPGEHTARVFRLITHPVIRYQIETADSYAHTYRTWMAEKRVLESRLAVCEQNAISDPSVLSEIHDINRRLAALQEPVLPRFIVGDIPRDRLVAEVVRQGGTLGLLSPDPELVGILTGLYSPDASPSLDVLLKGYTGDPMLIDRPNETSIVIPRTTITVGGLVTPPMLESLVRDAYLVGRGWIACLALSNPPPLVGKRRVHVPDIPPAIANRFADAWRMMIAHTLAWEQTHRHDRTVLEVHPADAILPSIAAYQLALEQQMGEEGTLRPIIAWASKQIGRALRIAVLLHMADDPDVPLDRRPSISPSAWRRAMDISEYMIAHARSVLLKDHQDEIHQAALHVLALIRRRHITILPRSEIFSLLPPSRRTRETVAQVIALLSDYGYLTELDVAAGGRGRTPSRYMVNPSVHTLDRSTTTVFFPPMATRYAIAVVSEQAFLSAPPVSLETTFRILQHVRAWNPTSHIVLHANRVELVVHGSDPPPDALLADLRTIAPLLMLALSATPFPTRQHFQQAMIQLGWTSPS